MILKIILFSYVLLLSDAALEGEYCMKDGTIGTCTSAINCSSAIEDIKHKRHPQLCGFNKTDAIICCFDKPVPAGVTLTPVITQRPRPAQSTTEYVPLVDKDDYVIDMQQTYKCAPIPNGHTSKNTGQKAFEMCIEYQEKYVYSCDDGLTLLGEGIRSDHCTHRADELIVGGEVVSKDQFTHIVMLGYEDGIESIEWQCAGSIISDHFILTAGHCTHSRALGHVKYIVTGAVKQNEKKNAANTYNVARVILHPDFKSPVKYHDIALLETDRPLKLSPLLVPACLHSGDPVKDNRVISITWGMDSQRNSDFRHKTLLRKPPAEECSAKYPPHRLMRQGIDNATQMCYGDSRLNKDLCLGVTGGPIQIESADVRCMHLILGLMLGNCGIQGNPGIFTRVSAYIPWIESIVWP